MGKPKLLMFMLDALCSSDLPFMRQLPHFSQIFANGSLVTHIEPAYPSLTYPCHATILTGKNPEGHGIFHNERIRRGGHLGEPWFSMYNEMKARTLLDYAAERGMTTCSLNWPVTGGAAWDYNMPMIVPYDYRGYEPEPYLRDTVTPILMEKYFWKYGRFQKGVDRSIDLHSMALAPDIIQDFGQCDVMLVKMGNLDTVRHIKGVYGEHVNEQLRVHDEELGVLMESIRRYGDYDSTNFVILGDHGQSNTDDVLHMNTLFEQEGFLRSRDGKLVSFDALSHWGGFSSFIEIRDPRDKKLYDRVYAFLKSLSSDSRIKLEYIFTAEEARSQFGLTGPFDFVIESGRRVSFSEKLGAGNIYGGTDPEDYHKIGSGMHGGLPFINETTAFIAAGPALRRGVVLDRRSMVDEAPTMAKILGFEMDDVDGQVMADLLN
jgi:predicted AlkP superfamily pyrophosphatase or phosphodiesterase